MTAIQNNIVDYLNDYVCFIGHKAHKYEMDGLNARSDRLKEKVIEVNQAIRDYKIDCKLHNYLDQVN